MPSLSACPEVHELERFLLGQLADADIETLQHHLAQCAACRARIEALEVQDTMVKALPAVFPLAPPPENSAVNNLINRLQRLPLDQVASLSGAADEATVKQGADGNEELTPLPGRPPVPFPQVGRYEIQEEIARGGMGAVWRAQDTAFQRTVALKVLLASPQHRPELKRRFLDEAQILGQLQHPGIPPVHDRGELPDGRPFFAMKLIQGRTLAELLRERSTPAHDLPRFLAIFGQLCQAVAYAHSRGIIHRDLKPSNVMVGAFGEVQVMDWGLAKRLGGGGCKPSGTGEDRGVHTPRSPEASREETKEGDVLGTPAYMAPEQARGEIERLDERCDAFGLGASLCMLLTGQPPYVGPNLLARAAQGTLADVLDRLDSCAADVELATLARRCLAPAREERPRSAGEVAEAVAMHQARVQERLRQAELERTQAQVKAAEEGKRRRLALALAATLLVLVTGAAGAGLWYQHQEAVWAEEQALQEKEQALRLAQTGAGVREALKEVTRVIAS
jgi:hypothetical protein